MKKFTLSAWALFVAALSFNVAAQDNAEKVKERIMPLIDGKLDNAEQDELFGSLVFDNDRLVSYKYDELENNLSSEEFEKALLVMIDKKAAVVIRDGQAEQIGVEIPAGTKVPVTVITFNRAIKQDRFNCQQKPQFVCITGYYPGPEER